MSQNAWKILSNGAELVLAVDFSNTGRLQAGFHDLVPRLEPAHTVWETLPPAAGTDSGAYVEWWLGEVRAAGRPVHAVLGYCAGAVFAAEMAERIATWQDAPLLVLLDPELPKTVGLYRDFHTAGDSMTALLSPDELREFHEAGWRVQEKFGDDDITAVGPALGEIFTAAVATAAERLELDDELRDELAGVFGSLIGYLTAAGRFDPREVWARSTAITSAELGSGAVAGREIQFPVKHDDLLRHDEAARALSELLSGDRVG